MGLKFKEGVLLERDGVVVSPKILLAIQAAEGVWRDAGLKDLTITALLDGDHKIGSKHYKGEAVDLRTKSTGMATRLHSLLRTALPLSQYDVLLEDLNGPAEHVHVEADDHTK